MKAGVRGAVWLFQPVPMGIRSNGWLLLAVHVAKKGKLQEGTWKRLGKDAAEASITAKGGG